MALSTYDQKLSTEDQKKIEAYKVAWAQAKAAGDTAGMESAHSAAESIRAGAGYSGGGAGDQFIALNPTETVTSGNAATINSVYENMLKSQNAQIEAARSSAVSGYEADIEAAPQEYAGYRNQVDVNTARSIQSQNEIAAAKGTTFTGGVQSDVGATQAAGAAQKTAYTREEANLIASLKRAIADTNKAASLQQVSAAADIQAQQTNALLADRQQSVANALSMAQLTGTLNGQTTLAGRSQDLAEQSYQTSVDQWNQTFEYQKSRDAIQDGQWLKSFNLSASSTAADIAYKKSMLEWSMSPDNPDNVLTTLEDQGASESYINAFSDVMKYVTATTDTLNNMGTKTGETSTYSVDQLKNIIDAEPGLTSEEKLQLYNMVVGVIGQ